MNSACVSRTAAHAAAVIAADAKSSGSPNPTNACTMSTWKATERNVNILWKFTNTMPHPRCSWNVFSNTALRRRSRSDAPCAVLQKWRNRAYAETAGSAPGATGTSTPSNKRAAASRRQNVSFTSSYPTRRCRRLVRFMDSTTAPWNGATMLRTKSPSGSGKPAPRTARTVEGLDADGAVTHAAAAWYANESISGKRRQFAASVYMSSNSTSWCSLVSSRGAPVGCLRAASTPCTYPRLVGWPGRDKSSNLVCANHRSYPAKVFACSASAANSAGGPLAVAAPATSTGHSCVCVRFHRFLARRSTTSSRVDSGASAASAWDARDWNPNRSPSVAAAGARRARHASTPFSMSDEPSGAGPRRESRASSSASSAASLGGSSFSSTANGAFVPGLDASNASAADMAASSSGAGAVTSSAAPGIFARASEMSASRVMRLSCFRFMSSATSRYAPPKITATVVTCTSSFMASICSCCGQEVSPGCSNERSSRDTYATTSSITAGAGGHVCGLRLWICACAWHVKNVLCRLEETGFMTPLGWLSCTEKFSKCAKMGTGWSGLSVIS